MVSRKEPDWQELAEKRLNRLVKKAQKLVSLKRMGPKSRTWQVSVRVVGLAAMKKLNSKHRKKSYATDVLSFPPPAIFFEKGILGELLLCLPVLKRQARELGHPAEKELDVLLAHGLLHLLGFDHEKGKKEAAAQMSWEIKLLGARSARVGLIERSVKARSLL